MELIRILRTDKWVTSGGFKTSAKIGLFKCPNCNEEIEKHRSAGIKAKSCGSPKCRKATWTASPHNKGTTKKNRIQDIPYYTVLKERYRVIKQKHTICNEWNTFEGFVKDMAESYKEARKNGTKIYFIVTGLIASKETSKWSPVGKFNKYPVSKDKALKYLYIVESVGHYKIGITNNVQSRMTAISTCNPLNVELKYAKEISNAYETEQSVHDKYKEVNVKGEWFKLSDEQLEEVVSYLDNLS